jgi:superfamily II DNA/RNA helicase
MIGTGVVVQLIVALIWWISATDRKNSSVSQQIYNLQEQKLIAIEIAKNHEQRIDNIEQSYITKEYFDEKFIQLVSLINQYHEEIKIVISQQYILDSTYLYTFNY